ncbi:MAG: hypothetical protein COC22_06975 [Flavobacteriaceae bacterium]|nr:MAG: hypothetical protein COC22_06975 [Flavobacteriaceae bacterium]
MEFLSDEKFYIPLLATLGASLAVIGIQALSRYEKEQKQRVYTASYMLDVSFRVLSSILTVKVHTILPHIEATKRIYGGDEDLLNKTLLSDEFDILKAKPASFSHLPDEYKFLVGYDDIEIIQIFSTLLYLYECDENRRHLNEFVKDNLKSMSGFLSKSEEEKEDILNTYYDLLGSLDHESNRIIVFVSEVVLPKLEAYIREKQFLLFKTSSAKRRIKNIKLVLNENSEYLPESGYMNKVKYGGIQGEL